jgi:hypothetical protein
MSEDLLPERELIPVIARSHLATKQSRATREGSLDCFVASAPRNDECASAVSDETLRQVAADLNFAPGAAERVARMAALVEDNNRRIADAALNTPFDSSPYSFAAWLAATDAQ